MRLSKRALDLVVASLGLVACSPLFALIAVSIKIGDRGPVFFRQVRVGRSGRPFRMWKFRTMVADADRIGGALTVGRDPRITVVGRWLRASKLDELPQLLNIVAGEMSLVGPRPEVPRYVDLYSKEQRQVLELTPGLTDPASIRYHVESQLLARAGDPEREYVETIMPTKLRMNLEYAERATLLSDLLVILRTFGLFLVPAGEPRLQASGRKQDSSR